MKSRSFFVGYRLIIDKVGIYILVKIMYNIDR